MDKLIQIQHITPDMVHVMVKGEKNYWFAAAKLDRVKEGWRVSGNRFRHAPTTFQSFEDAVEDGIARAKDTEAYYYASK